MSTDYAKAYKITMAHEGGYVNHPNDRGGETFKGISRRWFPDWEGWEIIDRTVVKDQLANEVGLNNMVAIFYRQAFWDRIKGDHLIQQDIAELMFDTAVITGVPDAIEYLQLALNLCNRNGRRFADLKVDKMIGAKTIGALFKAVQAGEGWAVYGYILLHRGEASMIDMRNNPDQEINAIGWLRRLLHG